jgi:hypothetical protein
MQRTQVKRGNVQKDVIKPPLNQISGADHDISVTFCNRKNGNFVCMVFEHLSRINSNVYLTIHTYEKETRQQFPTLLLK